MIFQSSLVTLSSKGGQAEPFKCIFTDGQHQEKNFTPQQQEQIFLAPPPLEGCMQLLAICSSLLLAFSKVRLNKSIPVSLINFDIS